MDDRYVFIDTSVLSGIYSHALSNREEIAGLLIGKKINEKLNNNILITDFSPQDGKGTNVSVTLTPEHVTKVSAELDERKTDEKIVGWYHSHPQLKSFMSSDDEKVQEIYQNQNGDFVGLVASYISDNPGNANGLKFNFGIYRYEKKTMTELRCRLIPKEYIFDLPHESSKKLQYLLKEFDDHIDINNKNISLLPIEDSFIRYINSLNGYFLNTRDTLNKIKKDQSNIERYIRYVESQIELAKIKERSEKEYEQIKSDLYYKNSELESIKGFYEKSNKDNAKLNNDNRELNIKNGKLKEEIKKLETEKISLNENIKNLTNNNKELEDKRKDIHKEYSKSLKEVEEYKKDNQKLREKINKLENNMARGSNEPNPKETVLGSVRDSLGKK